MRSGAILLGLLALTLTAPGAEACNCPKEAMIKEHGTVGLLPPKPPGPRRPSADPALVPAKPAVPPLPMLISADGDGAAAALLRLRGLDASADLLLRP
jgi:hypothetical protein